MKSFWRKGISAIAIVVIVLAAGVLMTVGLVALVSGDDEPSKPSALGAPAAPSPAADAAGSVAAGDADSDADLDAILAWYEDDSEEYVEDDAYWQQESQKRKGKTAKRERAQLAEDCEFESIEELEQFVHIVMNSTTEVWTKVFRENELTYRPPKLNIFSDEVSTGCGPADYSDGPFYCGADETVYLDLNFFVHMTEEVGTGGDFAYAYVIAHEVGHHVQNLIGTSDKYSEIEQKLRERGKDSKANLISVQTELQADFYAGVWAHHEDQKYNSISEDDIEKAFNAAIAVGDDSLGEESRENFGHGSAQMRLVWLYNGMLTGDVSLGDTFQYRSLTQLENAVFEDEEEEEDGRSFREKKMEQ